MSNRDHDPVGVGRPALGRIGGREWALGFASFMLVATACGNASSPSDSGDGGTQGTTSGSSSGNGGSSTGNSSTGSSGNGSGAGNSSGSSGGAGSGSGSGSSSGSGGSGAAPPVSCGDGGLPTGSGASSGSSTDTGASCPVSASGVRVTEVDVGMTYSYQEVDTPLSLLAISPIPGGGSRLAFMGSDSKVHIALLDGADNLVTGSTFALPAHDFQDIYADNTGGVVLVTRDAMGGGTNNCGNPANLCSLSNPTNYSCWDMYLVRFDVCGNETWATKLTTSSASLPPYSTGPTGSLSLMIWWYAHNGRIAFDGTNFAAYYGVAITVKNQGGMSCMDIHQGDEMRLVNAGTGKLGAGGFDIGCSHSAFERITWDGAKFVTVCNLDAPTGGKSGQVAFAPNRTTIYPVDELNTELGSVLPAGGGGYWIVTTDLRAGQTAASPGLDDVHLLHVTTGAPDKNLTLASDSGLNDRNPHLAAFGKNRMLAAWETSTTQAPQGGHLSQNDTSRKLYVQALDSATGAAQGAPYNITGVTGSRYQDFRAYPDGSLAYAAPGSAATKVKIVRASPCR
jgi:hypothetical protein